MANYLFTNKAVDDLSEIWNYTYYKWSENQADKYYEMLIENCEEIAFKPDKLGISYNEIAENLRGLKVGRHIIFYRKLEENLVEISRILHEQMDLKSKMNE
jgi:toxin ParE1/3/4